MQGSATPENGQNIVEWTKVSPVARMPAGHNGTIQPLAVKSLNEAMMGQRTPRDAAVALAKEITPLLENA